MKVERERKEEKEAVYDMIQKIDRIYMWETEIIYNIIK